LRPFPQSASGSKKLKELWTEYRGDMISEAGISVFLFGNKLNDLGELVVANGMKEEFNIAKKMGKFIIPIGSTGYVAKWILDEVKMDLTTYWYLKESLDVLEYEEEESKIIDEIICIIERIRKEI
jgi:hypothetical protein